MELPKIILGSGKDQSVRRFHPWIFSGAIKKIKGEAAEGDLVQVYSNHDELLGHGHFSGGSIAVRMIQFGDGAMKADFWNEKIKQAVQFRKNIGLNISEKTNCFRLIFGEGDGLPGLIADYYNGTVVIQCHSTGMYLSRKEIVEALKEAMGKDLKGIYDKSAETLPDVMANDGNGWLFGNSENNTATENGFHFLIDWEKGQKTGFFLDQRENRRILGEYAKGKSVLNTFCYTGGFSVYALGMGATRVVSLDSSQKAMDLTAKNVALNFGEDTRHENVCADTFDYLTNMEELFDIIVLDPPAFAKHHHVKHKAVQGYKRLNQMAISKIKPGGLLFTFSCSQAVDKFLFFNTITSAAILAGRKVRPLALLGQPADHAPSLFHPEGEYLKGMLLMVD
jgi:23S rRNA (cytosine1962-C5)-methyltransferase